MLSINVTSIYTYIALYSDEGHTVCDGDWLLNQWTIELYCGENNPLTLPHTYTKAARGGAEMRLHEPLYVCGPLKADICLFT